jgi:hypothetical protein
VESGNVSFGKYVICTGLYCLINKLICRVGPCLLALKIKIPKKVKRHKNETIFKRMSADKHFIVSNVIEAGVKVGRVVESVGGVGEELIA